MLRLTTRCKASTSSFLKDARPLRTVTVLPRGMQRFEQPSPSPSSLTSNIQSTKERPPPSGSAPTSSTSSYLQSTSRSQREHQSSVRYQKLRRSLPPWPVDAVEFNALSVDGGHGARKAWEHTTGGIDAFDEQDPIAQLRDTSDDDVNTSLNGASSGGLAPSVKEIPKTIPLTPEVLKRLVTAELSAAAQTALAVGGWVCTGCWTVQNPTDTPTDPFKPDNVHAGLNNSSEHPQGSGLKHLLPRTVCPVCRTLRHDAQTWPLIATLRAEAAMEVEAEDGLHLWVCAECGEVNKAEDPQGVSESAKESQRDEAATTGAITTTAVAPGLSSLAKGTSAERVDEAGKSTCRCCGGTSHMPTPSHLPSPSVLRLHKTVADEVAAAPLGSVVVTRNRTTRWRCGHCGEVNSLQLTECRNCARDRFGLTVLCPQCEAPRVLSNALIQDYQQPSTAVSSSSSSSSSNPSHASPDLHTGEQRDRTSACEKQKLPKFSIHNCYQPGSTQLACLQCGSALHGGALRPELHGPPSWWCACGTVNPTLVYSCQRCRLPRTVSDPAFLQRLLRDAVASPHTTLTAGGNRNHHDRNASNEKRRGHLRWDFAECTSWLCDSCDGVNRAAYEVTALRTTEARFDKSSTSAASNTPMRHKARVWVDNGVQCVQCSAPWHHQLLQNGEWWRCACHAVNRRESAACTSCGLPALDGMSGIVLSAWSRGDWWCHACGTHCYRDRLRCRCGADRPT